MNFIIFGPGLQILDISSRFWGGNFTSNPTLRAKIANSSVQRPTHWENYIYIYMYM